MNQSLLDKLIFQQLQFYGYHGVFLQEKLEGQYFLLDAELGTCFGKASQSDELLQSIDYSKVYKAIQNIVCNTCFDLLEALASYICWNLLRNFAVVEYVKLRLYKPSAPLEGGLKSDAELRAVLSSTPQAPYKQHEADANASANALANINEGCGNGGEPQKQMPSWNCGAFAKGGCVLIEIQRSRSDLQQAFQWGSNSQHIQ